MHVVLHPQLPDGQLPQHGTPLPHVSFLMQHGQVFGALEQSKQPWISADGKGEEDDCCNQHQV